MSTGIDPFAGIAAIVLCFGIVAFIISFMPEKSRRYRKVLTDLYVAGRVKQLATKDGIDLEAERLEFIKWSKKERNKEMSLDTTIEEELQDRISEEDSKKKK